MIRGAVRVGICFVAGFTAVSALVGGLLIAAGIDTFPPGWLAGSPFGDYKIPGLILAVVVGGSATVATVAEFRLPRVAGPATIAAGAILLGWIAGEVVLLHQNGATTSPRSPIEVIYAGLGLAMVLLGVASSRSRRAGDLR